MSAIETAKQHWGENMPDWIEVLASEADKSSQNKIAQKIGKSSAAISQVLKNIYPGTIENVEAAVRANLMNGSHECPVFGTLTKSDFLEPAVIVILIKDKENNNVITGCPEFNQFYQRPSA